MTVVTHRPMEVRRLAAVAVAVVPVLHGVAHFAGLTDLFAEADARQDVQYLGGLWTISDPSVLRVIGVLWAVVGVGVNLMLLAVVAFVPQRVGLRTPS